MQALDFQDPEVHHRHLSHLFGLYPGHTITMENNPDVCAAVSNSLYKRGLHNFTKLHLISQKYLYTIVFSIYVNVTIEGANGA